MGLNLSWTGCIWRELKGKFLILVWAPKVAYYLSLTFLGGEVESVRYNPGTSAGPVAEIDKSAVVCPRANVHLDAIRALRQNRDETSARPSGDASKIVDLKWLDVQRVAKWCLVDGKWCRRRETVGGGYDAY